MTKHYNPNDLTSYTVAQLRGMNSRHRLGIGNTSYMKRQSLIENIEATDYWKERMRKLKLGILKEESDDDNDDELKPIIIKSENKPPIEEKKEVGGCVKCMSGGCNSCNSGGGLNDKISINSSTDDDGNSIIVIMIKK